MSGMTKASGKKTKADTKIIATQASLNREINDKKDWFDQVIKEINGADFDRQVNFTKLKNEFTTATGLLTQANTEF